MIIGIVKERRAGERRVALIPGVVEKLLGNGESGLEIRLEKNAGAAAYFPDEAYEAAGATVCDDAISEADIILKVQAPEAEEIKRMKKGAVCISFLWAAQNEETREQLREAGITALGMDAVPRISRAQKMDALSSMSSIAGYKAVLIAAEALPKYMPMMMTAAGTIAPAKVLVLGAGVAGLQAIATARRLGAVVEAFDVRPAVKEQVESLGATFVETPLAEEDKESETKEGYAKELSEASKKLQQEKVAERVAASDMVITTALIPGKPAPKLISEEMVANMKPGSVIVDLAAEQGGNCALTKPDEVAEHGGVRIFGPTNISSQLPLHASQLYAKNLHGLLQLLIKDGEINLNFEDEVILQTTVTHEGEIKSPFVRGQLGLDD
ncbi:MAG: Re/Si-specific NAD(P)(+) transhydrogenase subunit alpha [Cyclonatronaceae bacterium]